MGDDMGRLEAGDIVPLEGIWERKGVCKVPPGVADIVVELQGTWVVDLEDTGYIE